MLLLLIIALPACVELAAWVVDSKFERFLLKSWPASEVDAVE